MTAASDRKQIWGIAVSALLGALLALQSWLLIRMNDNIDQLSKSFTDYKEKVAETYVTKADMGNYLRRAN